MRRNLAVILFTALLVGGYFITEDVRTVSHHASAAKPFAAAYALLQHEGIDSQRIYGSARLFPLPDTDTLLIMDAERGRLSEEHIAALHSWVKAGGRLVLVAKTLYYDDSDTDTDIDDEDVDNDFEASLEEDDVNYAIEGYDEVDLQDNDALMYSFGVSAWYVPREEFWPAVPAYAPDSDASIVQNSARLRRCLSPTGSEKENCATYLCGNDEHTVTYSFGYIADLPRQAAFTPQTKLMHIDQFDDDQEYDATTPETETHINVTLDNEYGAQLLQLLYGEGDIIAITGLHIWSNQQLGYLDHAWLLHTISAGHSHVWWIHSVDMPPLMAWLWQRAWPLLCASALLLGLFLWMKIPRQGVLLTTGTHASRDFLDHLRASANFLWRNRRSDSLIKPLRDEVLRRQRQRTGSTDLDTLCRLAEQELGMLPEQTRLAMSHLPSDDQELTHMISTLQQLRSRL